jgi:hypothetical protein
MSTLVTRAGKGSPLTHNEVDANFNNLNTDKIQSGNTVAALTITSASIVDLAVTGITSFDGAQGTAGQVLTSAGTGATPTWTTLSTGSGTVTSVSVVSANGFAGTVANSTTTPAITLSTSITGVLKGNGTAISAATAGTDYSAGTSALGTGILKSTTTTGALTIAVAGDFPTLNQNTTGSSATVTGNATGSTFGFNSGYGSVVTAYGCRAWVNFNGTGTPAIRSSGNVTSITDNNAGDYTINITTAFPDANYAVSGAVRNTQTYAQVQCAAVSIAQSTAPTTSALRITTTAIGDGGARVNIDSDYVCVSIIR